MTRSTHSTRGNRQMMLNIIDAINWVDPVLRPITLWLNYNSIQTDSCCAGHPLSPRYQVRDYDIFGYIDFRKTPKLAKFLEFLEKNGFEIVDKESKYPIAKFIFIRVENSEVAHHYKNGNTPEIFQQEIDTFWEYLFEEMRHLKV